MTDASTARGVEETGDWQIVPREPTEAMQMAGVKYAYTPMIAYRAMLAAAPRPVPSSDPDAVVGVAREIEHADVNAALLTFEQWPTGPLRHPEGRKWHLRDKQAMREVLKQYRDRLAADSSSAQSEGGKPDFAAQVRARVERGVTVLAVEHGATMQEVLQAAKRVLSPAPQPARVTNEDSIRLREAAYNEWFEHPARDGFSHVTSPAAFNAGWDAARIAVPADTGSGERWQGIQADEDRIAAWVTDRFGPSSLENPIERADRLLEEAIEMQQAVYHFAATAGAGRERAIALIHHVHAKEPGDPQQEMGGVMTCALALGRRLGVRLDVAAQTELDRIEGLSKAHFDKRHQAKVDAGVAAQHDRPIPQVPAPSGSDRIDPATTRDGDAGPMQAEG